MPLPRSYSQAKLIGAKRYFTGLACCHGHVAERCTAKRMCVECKRVKSAVLYVADPSVKKIGYADWYRRNRQRRLERGRLWEKNNRQARREITRRRRERLRTAQAGVSP